MSKVLYLNENQLKLITKKMINEANGLIQIGRTEYQSDIMSRLEYATQDKFIDRRLSNAYFEWKENGFARSGDAYINYCSCMDHFLNSTLGGILSSLENKKARVPFNYLILDPQWARIMIQGGDRKKETGENEQEGKNSGFRCLYTLIQTIYQNTSCLNDYAFNDAFEPIRNAVSSLVKQAIQFGPEYKKIMPLQQIRELNAFKSNPSNKNEQTMFDPNWREDMLNQRIEGEEDFD